MTIEQIKEEAKKRFDKDLTDEQAQAWLDAHPTGELQDEELANVTGGCAPNDKYGPAMNCEDVLMPRCPQCGHKRCIVTDWGTPTDRMLCYYCSECHKWLGTEYPDRGGVIVHAY